LIFTLTTSRTHEAQQRFVEEKVSEQQTDFKDKVIDTEVVL